MKNQCDATLIGFGRSSELTSAACVRGVRKHRCLAASVGALTIFAWSGAAFAQGVPTSANSSDSSANLDEIVVTAQKRAEPLSKTPLAISALSNEQLQSAGVVSLQNLTSVVPGIQMRTVSLANSIQVAIRGISNTDFNQTGNPAVSTYIDGVYVGRTQGLYGALYDLERIEVLRGPQGTLYGRNATGGNLNIITAEPTNSFHASADASYGNYNDVQVHGMLNVPVSDTLAVRGAFVVHRSDGFYDTLGTTAHDGGRADDIGGRLTILWTPSTKFKWRLSVDDYIARGTPGLDFDTGPDGKPLDGLPIFRRPLANSPEPINNIRNLFLRSRMDWQLSDKISLAYLAGYQNLKYDLVFSSPPPLTILDGSRNDKSESMSHELNLSFESSRIKNIFGFNYFWLGNENNDGYHLYNFGLTFGAKFDDSHKYPVRTHSWGIFDQFTFNATDKLRLTGGVRYSRESQAVDDGNQVFCPMSTYPNLPFSFILSLQSLPGCFSAAQAAAKGTWSSVTWKAGVDYDLSDRTMIFASATSGFKSGGLNQGVPEALTFRPEKVRNYEVGLKTHMLGNALSLNADLFYADYRDLQVTQIPPTLTSPITDNAARAAIYGLEVEAQLKPTRADTLSGFITLMKATYKDYPNAVDQQFGVIQPNLSGNYLPHAPRLSGRFEYAHEFSFADGASLTPSASVYYQSKTYLREFNFPVDRVGGYAKVDLRLAYENSSRNWTAEAFVYNLSNTLVRSNGFTSLTRYESGYDPPRTYGVRLSYRY